MTDFRFSPLTKGTIHFNVLGVFYLGIRQLYQNTAVPVFSPLFFTLKNSHYQPVQLVTRYQKPGLVFHLREKWIQITGCHGNYLGSFPVSIVKPPKKKNFSSIRWKLMNTCCCILKRIQLNKKVIIFFDQGFPPTPRNIGRSVSLKWEGKSI